MFGPTPTHPRTLASNSASSTIPECSGEATLNEQALSFTTTDLNIMEMTEIEYTQLQQILYSHMDSQTSDGDIDTRMNSAFFPSGISSNVPQYQSTNITNQASFTTSSSVGLNVRPVICQSVSSESNIMSSNQTLGHIDFQELRMMMINESNKPSKSSNTSEKNTNNTGGDTSGASNVWTRQAGTGPGINKENENLGHLSETRSKSAVCVRLEDRFNSIETEVPRCQEPQESSVTLNNLVSLICHPSQLVEAQQQNKCGTLVQNKTPVSKASLQFKYPGINLMDTATFGNAGSSQTQTNFSVGCGNSCPLLEASKHQEMSLPRTFSFCYQQEIESTKQTLGAQKKSLPEQVWIKVGGALCKQAINKRSRSSIRQVDASMERKPLSDMQNLRDTQTSGASWSPTKTNTVEQKTNNKQGGSSQRREKHNRMERDRRRRIRICCDELNLLVPFCNVETDKATTLQWTTAFLKYIQERDGDSLKKEFENVFCGKTGRRLKVARAGHAQETSQNSSLQDVK